MKISKQFFISLLSIFICLQCISQDSYKAAIHQAEDAINKGNYPAALQLYNSAKAFEPSKSDIVDKQIDTVFKKIVRLKDSALAETRRADSLNKIADSNYNIAKAALKISHANQIMYEAQGAVKYDPLLALHLAAAALDSIRSITNIKIDDSLIFDKAYRIYYENNFGQTIVSDSTLVKTDCLGKFTGAIYSPDNNSVWTITDKLYAVKWTNGNLETKIKLDTAYQEYTFKQLGKDSLLLYGIDRGKDTTRKKSIKVWVITNKKTPPAVYADSSGNGLINSSTDLISLNAGIDKSKGWAERLFVFDDRVFQFNGDGKLMLVNTFRGDIRHIAFSPDGKLIAISNSKRGLKIFNTDGTILDSNINIGDTASDLKFSPDNKVLLVRQKNSLQFFNAYDLRARPTTLEFFPSRLQSYEFSSDADGQWLAVSTLSGNQQVIKLYKKNIWKFELYAQSRWPGSLQTSAVFSKDNKAILSSSDKIRLWKIPSKTSEPVVADTRSEFISSVQYNAAQYQQDTTLNCITLNDKTLSYKYFPNGTIYIDSAYYNPQSNLTTRLAAFLGGQRTLIVSEDGLLLLYFSKDETLEEFLKNFPFDDFTVAQKKRYGIEN